jgi:non-specific serine/threonine protein kinase
MTSSTAKAKSQEAASTTTKSSPESTTSPAKSVPAGAGIQPGEDDRAWAAIRNSRNVADFFAFQLKYPKSSHSRAAASRIKELQQASAPSAQPPSQSTQVANQASTLPRPSAQAPKQSLPNESATAPQTAPATQASAAAEPSAARPRAEASRPPASAAAQKGVVRIRVRPFGYVYVDGELVGASPPMREVPLAFGKHRIEARNSEVRPGVVSTEVDVADSEPRDVQLRFTE